ncbi:MAG TPA: kelch repeat-containing protein [Longimicrobiales bacterium]
MPRIALAAALAVALVPPAASAQQPTVAWSAGPSLAIPRDHHAVFAVHAPERDFLYVAGGTNYRDMFADVSRAEIRDDGTLGEWESAMPLPTPRAGLSVVVSGGVVVAAGGQIQTADRRLPRIAEVYVARLDENGRIGEWRAAAPLPAPRFHHPMLAHAGRVYVVGGQGERDAEAGVFVARVDDDGGIREWLETTPLPRARSHHAALVHGGHVYVFGGLDGAPGRPQAGFFDVIRAPILDDGMLGDWQTVALMPHSLATHSAFVHDATVWMLGGVEDMQRFVADVWSAPLEDDGGIGDWEAVTPALPVARGHVHVTPVVRNRVYSVGGRITTADGRPGVTGDVHIGVLP